MTCEAGNENKTSSVAPHNTRNVIEIKELLLLIQVAKSLESQLSLQNSARAAAGNRNSCCSTKCTIYTSCPIFRGAQKKTGIIIVLFAVLVLQNVVCFALPYNSSSSFNPLGLNKIKHTINESSNS